MSTDAFAVNDLACRVITLADERYQYLFFKFFGNLIA